ncbi:O-antigen ligase family protein [Mycetocola sp. 2940]|uniref:O-antigen ligase family protein n=1 Tax=Mycetocola sp. 2940 TaxID=3156452 RepID=UPI00339A28C5
MSASGSVVTREPTNGRSRRSPVDWASVTVGALFAYAVVPAAAQNVLNPRSRIAANLEITTSTVASGLGTVLTFALLAIVLFAFLATARFGLRWWMVLLVLPWLAQIIATLYGAGSIGPQQLVYPLVVVIAAGALHPKNALRLMGTLTVGLAAVSVAVGLFLPAQGLWSQDLQTTKALIGNSLLAGVLYHPNALGQMLAFGLPFVLLIRNVKGCRIGFGIVLIALVWTGSRTALIAAALGLLTIGLWKLSKGKSEVLRALSPLGLIIVYTGALLVSPLIVSTARPDSFTGRGYIWSGSLDLWRDSPLVGQGPGIFHIIKNFNNEVGSGAFHGHNLLVHILVTAGVLGVVAFVLLVILMIVRSVAHGKAGHFALASYAVVLLVTGWLEMPTDFISLSSQAWIIWVPLVLLCAEVKSEPDSGAVSRLTETIRNRPKRHAG